jgi:hypothetical protein
MTTNGIEVTVRGERYKVVGVGPASTDAKFFGRRRFILRKLGTTETYVTYGKRVAYNSRLLRNEGDPK